MCSEIKNRQTHTCPRKWWLLPSATWRSRNGDTERECVTGGGQQNRNGERRRDSKVAEICMGNGNELVRLERLRHVCHHEKYCVCGISKALSADFGFCSKFGRETETYVTLHIKAKFGKLGKKTKKSKSYYYSQEVKNYAYTTPNSNFALHINLYNFIIHSFL